MSNLAALPRREADQPPANVEGEAALLGAALIDNAVLDLAAARLAPGDFFEPAHGRIFDQAVRSRADGSTVTVLTIVPHFATDDGLRELGGPTYLARLTGDAQGMLAPRELISQIAELSARRKRRNWLTAELSAAADLGQPLAELVPPDALSGAKPLEPLDLAAMAGRDPKAKTRRNRRGERAQHTHLLLRNRGRALRGPLPHVGFDRTRHV